MNQRKLEGTYSVIVLFQLILGAIAFLFLVLEDSIKGLGLIDATKGWLTGIFSILMLVLLAGAVISGLRTKKPEN